MDKFVFRAPKLDFPGPGEAGDGDGVKRSDAQKRREEEAATRAASVAALKVAFNKRDGSLFKTVKSAGRPSFLAVHADEIILKVGGTFGGGDMQEWAESAVEYFFDQHVAAKAAAGAAGVADGPEEDAQELRRRSLFRRRRAAAGQARALRPVRGHFSVTFFFTEISVQITLSTSRAARDFFLPPIRIPAWRPGRGRGLPPAACRISRHPYLAPG